eukprot:CAMPEP_0113467282 /NCGR_PEP_ID=MMETSP0014_2-20120614/14730_1 /TAXON_ID=2857 /ORGANISM="Nitzschia sp." /LENGTH=1767 /DNA_ID=CAMNT_0000359577 /DNA_START=361 /DNA_END=5664 /DNA_ORIENTATION=+ /assembly_acc=CAM_ASM_000159
MDGWEESRFVPFTDYYSQEQRYPLRQPPVPLVGQIQKELPTEFSDPRIQEYPQLLYSSQTAAYHDSRTIVTNGFTTSLVPPDPQTDGLYNATGDLATFLRPLYESDPDLLRLRITFFADGFGTVLQFPAGEIASSYVSKGCDWIVQEDNPITTRPYGNLGHVSKCHFESEFVRPETAVSEFNGLDDGTAEWIIKELERQTEFEMTGSGSTKWSTATNSERSDRTDEVFWTGPNVVSDNVTAVLTAGKAIFDRLTGELVGFVTADVLEEKIAADLDTRILEESADVYAVDYHSGIIVSQSDQAEYPLRSILPQFESIRTYLNFESGGDEMSYWDRYGMKNPGRDGADRSTRIENYPGIEVEPCIYIEELPNGGILTASPLPLPPDPEDPARQESYRPSAYVVQIISNDVFSVVLEIEESINEDVRKNITWSCVAGALGLAVVLVLLSIMSRALTRPLTWITDVSRQIIYNDYGSKNNFSCSQEDDRSHQRYSQNDENSNHGNDDASNQIYAEEKGDENSTSTNENDDEGRVSGDLDKNGGEGPVFRSEVMASIDNAMQPVDIGESETNSNNNVNEREDGSDVDEEGLDFQKDQEYHLDPFDDYISAANQSRCEIPRTEIRQLVEEFQTMIHGFSGSGPSQVAEPAIFQLKNTLSWHDDFAKLYNSEGLTRRSFRQTSQSTDATETETDGTNQNQRSVPSTSQEEGGIQPNLSSPRKISLEAPKSYLAAAIEEEQQPEFQSQDMESEEESDEYLGSMLEIEPPVPQSPEIRNIDSKLTPQASKEARTLHDQEAEELDSDEESASLKDEDGRKKESVPSSLLDSSYRKSTVGFFPPPPPSSKIGHMGRAKIHHNPVLGTPKSERKPILEEDGAAEKAKVCCSKLFWCILFLMALPVLMTALVVSAIASSSVSRTLPDWINGAEVASISIEKDTLAFVADRKASVFSSLTQGTTRDLHFMNRITNWLYFGGVQRSTSFTEMDSGAEACKEFYEAGLSKTECPAFLDLPCSCDWKDLRQNKDLSPSCSLYPEVMDSRYLQRQGFAVQTLDSDPETGNRYASPSYPSTSNSPDSTSWWTNISALPGSEKGPESAGGYGTLYDRLAVASASSVFNFPVYNYATSLNRPKNFLGAHLSYDDDGMLMSYDGCQYGQTTRSNWVSTIENGGALVNKDLCPLGRYGYDSRCRSWYATGRDGYKQDQIPVHITAPYLFASGSGTIGGSITSPIANPRTGEYVGQVLLDFLPTGVSDSMNLLDQPLTFLITPDEDVVGGDTVVGPRFGVKDLAWKSSPIGDLIFLHEPSPENRQYFDNEILPSMKNGTSGYREFNITNDEGVNALMCLSFAPVSFDVMLPIAPDDYAAGVKKSRALVYSLGVGVPCQNISFPFRKVEGEVRDDLEENLDTYISVNVIATSLFIIFSAFAAAYISRPMIKLLNIVRQTNSGEPVDNIPPLKGGCKEVQDVYSTFAKLNKIVRVSNNSFFSGNLDMALHFVSDALTLFRHVDDQKAIAVACNNLANTLFALQHDQRLEKAPDPRQVDQVLSLYDEAVERGHTNFTSVDEDNDLKVRYALQLSDRVFNRGLYYFFLGDIERGTADIAFARNLYYDIREILLTRKQLFSTADEYFNRLLRRISCLTVCLQGFEGLRQLWDPETLIDEADHMVAAAWTATNCPLFREVQRIGRRQQLESSAILLAVHSECDDPLHAAKLGIRMLVEDLYMLEPAFVRAAEALLEAIEDGKVMISQDNNVPGELRIMLDSCRFANDFINLLTMEKF